MQICVQYMFEINFFIICSMISTYDITMISLIFGSNDASAFCMHELYNTSYGNIFLFILSQAKNNIANVRLISPYYTCSN
jgi:hypothetical protein